MQKKLFYLPVMLLLWQAFPLFSQPGVATVGMVKKEKDLFLRNLAVTSRDSSIVFPLARYFESEVNSLNTYINQLKLSAIEKEKAARSLVYFITELSKNIKSQKADIYEIPGSLHSYKSILTALINHKPLIPLLQALGPRRSQLMAAAFSQYKEYSLLDDIAVYKRVASSPQYILQFLENKPGFRFADSLLLDAAAYDPLKMIFYLNRDKPGVKDKIRNNKNIYLQQIASLSNDKQASELLPFVG